jgi:hypothetical protein
LEQAVVSDVQPLLERSRHGDVKVIV